MFNEALLRVYLDSRPQGTTPKDLGAREVYDHLVSIGVAKAFDEASRNAARGTTRTDSQIRQDAQTLAIGARWLDFVMTEVYEEPSPELRVANGDVIDINTSVPDGAKTFTYRMYSGRSLAKIGSSWSGGYAGVTRITGAEKPGTTHVVHNGWDYTTMDLRHAGFANVPLDSMLAKDDRRGHLRALNDVGLWGREDLNLPGLVTLPGQTRILAPLNAGSTSRAWSAKTAAEILADIATLVNRAGQISFGMRRTTHVWLPRSEYDLIAGMMVTTLATKTVLQWAKEIHQGVEFGILEELATSQSNRAGETTLNLASDSALAIVKNKDVLSLVVPMQYTQHAPQFHNLTIRIPTESMVGGVLCTEPPTVVRMDGIGSS